MPRDCASCSSGLDCSVRRASSRQPPDLTDEMTADLQLLRRGRMCSGATSKPLSVFAKTLNMGTLGRGYGSEWHLIAYLARHRGSLDREVRSITGADDVEWLDCPTNAGTEGLRDAEWKGLDFVEDAVIQQAWRQFWPQGAGIHNWDAVARLRLDGQAEWLLVEAKAHSAELVSNCGAKSRTSLVQIDAALAQTKTALGVAARHDWLTMYYQFSNRLAALHFLRSQGIPARLLFIYFTGDRSGAGRECPKDVAAWQPALASMDAHLGLSPGHALADRVHKLFLPVVLRDAR